MLILSQNGLWSVPNKQNPTFYSIFHAFSRPKFPLVCPFPIQTLYSRLLGIILSYRPSKASLESQHKSSNDHHGNFFQTRIV